MKINFKEFPIFIGIERTERVLFDVRRDLANSIYVNVAGIEAHVLAEKIYKSDGPIDMDPNETQVIEQSLPLFTGSFADSWHELLKECQHGESGH